MIRVAIVGATSAQCDAVAARLRDATLSPVAEFAACDAIFFADPGQLDLEHIARAGKPVWVAVGSGFSRVWLDVPNLTVVNPDRYLPSRQLIRQQLDAGELGEPSLLRVHRWASALDFDTALLRDVDLALWFFSKRPERVHAIGQTLRQIHLDFPGGGMALIDHASLPAGDAFQSVSLFGSAGAAYSDDQQNMQLLFSGDSARARPTAESQLVLTALVQDLVDAIAAGRDMLPLRDGWRAVLEVCEAVQNSLPPEPPAKSLADTAEIPILTTSPRASAGVGRVRVDYAAGTDTGRIRANNEDHYYVAHFGRYLGPMATNIVDLAQTQFAEEGYGLVIADGMGGAAAGERASKLAIQTLLDLVVETPDWIISTQGRNAERVMDRMAERYCKIDDVLMAEAAQHSALKGMGTTLTLACSVGSGLILTHVGDSRAYLFRNGALHQLTHDHTVAQALVDHGLLERVSDAATNLRHRLVRALGGIGQQCEADVQCLTLLDQDVLVLCTDGLNDMVPDNDIAAILRENPQSETACQALIARALANGGKDNVTVIVARYAFINRPQPSP